MLQLVSACIILHLADNLLIRGVDYRLRVTLTDSRSLTGQMLAYDKHLNLVLADCEEFRTIRKKAKTSSAAAPAADDGPQEMKRTLGLVILRGESIVSLSVEGPPPAPKEDPTAGVRWLCHEQPRPRIYAVFYSWRLVQDEVHRQVVGWV